MGELATSIIAIAGLLGIVAFVPALANSMRLPTTVMIGLVGCLVGVAIDLAPKSSALPPVVIGFLGGLGELPISAELILWVFLPIMLFEMALGLDGRELLEELGSILVMAILAVLVSTAVAGLLVHGVSAQGLAVSLMIAAIVATTDPSAVISIFRDLGAPRRLTTLIEGESLLNDAAAIVLFTTIMAFILQPSSFDAVETSFRFLLQFGGGLAFGATLARLMGGALGLLDRGGPAEATISFATAYLSYAIAEHYLGVSGVVSVVAAGLVLGTMARTRLATADWQKLLAIWLQLGFWASSLVLVLAATRAPSTLLSIRSHEILPLIALVGGVILARAFMVYAVLPLVVYLQGRRPIDRRYELVMLWGGLRGSVTLALAMAAAEHPDLSEETRHMVEVLATGLVFFTLFLQGTTLGWLIRRLELDRLSPVERILRERVLALTRSEIRDRISVAAIDHGLDLEHAAELAYLRAPSSEPEDARPELPEDVSMGQLRAAMATITNREIELYVEEMTLGMVSRAGGGRLVREANALLDALRHEGVQGYRHEAKRQDRVDRASQVSAQLHRWSGIGRPLARLLVRRMENRLVRRRVLEALASFNRRRISRLFDERVARTAEHILEERAADAERRLDAVRLQYPEHWTATASRYLAHVAIGLEEQEYARLHEERLLSPEIFRDLLSDLAGRKQLIGQVPKLDLGLDPLSLMQRVPLFASLPSSQIEELRRLLRSRLAFPGERLLRRGDMGDAMYFIASGAVEVQLQPTPVRLGTGDFFGEIALLSRGRRTSDVIVLSYSRLLVLKRESFRKFLEEHPELVRELERVATARLKELTDLGMVSRETAGRLLPDTELGEDPIQELLDPHPTGDLPQSVHRQP